MPIRFTCPHCGNSTDVAEQYAGQSGPCSQCGKTITVPPLGTAPMHFNAYPPPKPPRGTGSTLLIILAVALPILFICGGMLVALLLPAIQAAREAARRANCTNNMKQIGLALHNYHDKYKHFPPAYTTDKDGKPLHSWRVEILPFMEYQSLYDQIKHDEPWDSPHNKALASLMPPEFQCPSDPNPSKDITNYVMLVGPNAASAGPKGRKLSEFTNGTSNTIIVAETTGGQINWMEPRDLDVETMAFDLNDDTGNEMSSCHPGAVNALYSDGSVRSLSKSTDPNAVKSMTAVTGGAQPQPPQNWQPEEDF